MESPGLRATPFGQPKRFGASAIGSRCVLGHRMQKGGSGSGPGAVTTANEGLDGGAADFLLQGKEKRTLVTSGVVSVL